MIFFSIIPGAFFVIDSVLIAQDSSPLEVTSNKKVFATGDLIFFKIKVPNQGFLYLINQKTDGTLHLIYPNDEDENNFVQKGQFRIPSKKVDYEWVVDSPGGEESFFLILSEKQIKYFHKKSILKDQSINQDNWLRRHTSHLLPWEWKLVETKIKVK